MCSLVSCFFDLNCMPWLRSTFLIYNVIWVAGFSITFTAVCSNSRNGWLMFNHFCIPCHPYKKKIVFYNVCVSNTRHQMTHMLAYHIHESGLRVIFHLLMIEKTMQYEWQWTWHADTRTVLWKGNLRNEGTKRLLKYDDKHICFLIAWTEAHLSFLSFPAHRSARCMVTTYLNIVEYRKDHSFTRKIIIPS